MLKIKETIIVEGKFDRNHLKKITDAPIICTDGFRLYKDKSIIKAIKGAAEKTGVIILTDSDRAGFRIRNYIKQCVGSQGVVKHAYIPSVEGKERRKTEMSKEGLLGVEGITEDVLKEILKSVCEVKLEDKKTKPLITKTMLFEDGLSGTEESFKKRQMLLKELDLPLRISANAMLEVLNSVIGYDEYKKALLKIESRN